MKYVVLKNDVYLECQIPIERKETDIYNKRRYLTLCFDVLKSCKFQILSTQSNTVMLADYV